MKSSAVVLLVVCFVGLVTAGHSPSLIPRIEAILKYATDVLPTLSHYPSAQTALQNEISTMRQLVDSYDAAAGNKKQTKHIEQQLKAHARTVSMILGRLTHLRPIPIQPPHRPNPWTEGPQ